jgi:hypothetical protein
MAVRRTTIPRHRPGLEWREFGRDALLLDPATGEFLQINDTGRSIWTQVDGARSVAEITNAVALEFDEDPSTVSDDVEAFILELINRGILVAVAP